HARRGDGASDRDPRAAREHVESRGDPPRYRPRDRLLEDLELLRSAPLRSAMRPMRCVPIAQPGIRRGWIQGSETGGTGAMRIEAAATDLMEVALRSPFRTHWKSLQAHRTLVVRLRALGTVWGEGEAYTMDPEGARSKVPRDRIVGRDPLE